jgi:hypothetical protein
MRGGRKFKFCCILGKKKKKKKKKKKVLYPALREDWQGREVNHAFPFRAEFKGCVELHLYSLFGPTWPVLGRTLPSNITLMLFKHFMRYQRYMKSIGDTNLHRYLFTQ